MYLYTFICITNETVKYIENNVAKNFFISIFNKKHCCIVCLGSNTCDLRLENNKRFGQFILLVMIDYSILLIFFAFFFHSKYKSLQ